MQFNTTVIHTGVELYFFQINLNGIMVTFHQILQTVTKTCRQNSEKIRIAQQ